MTTHRDNPLRAHLLCGEHAEQTNRAITDDDDVDPGLPFAASAANQPVPSTSETARKLGTRSAGGTSVVATSVPSAIGTRSNGACAPVIHSRWARRVIPGATVRAGVVRGGERSDHELTAFDGRDAPANLLNDAASWPMGAGPLAGFRPRYGHRSDPQMHVTDMRIIASVGSTMVGSGLSS